MDHKTAMMAALASDGSSGIENVLMDRENDVSSLLEAIDFMNSEELNIFFSKLYQLASEISFDLCGEEGPICSRDEEFAQVKLLKDTENIEILKKLSSIILKYMEMSKASPPAVFHTAQILHDLLIPLDDALPNAPSLKVTIARICEKCWINETDGAEIFVTQLIPYLLIASLSPSVHDADVKRLYNIRMSFLLLDFDDESIESIRCLIIRCFLHPAFLRSADGRKFLSFLFSVHEGLNSMILEVMRPQIAAGSKGVPTAYGEILYRAWRDNSPDVGKNHSDVSIESIEEGIQGLFHDAVHAADPKYFKGLRIVLSAFHAAKKNKGVDSLLLRIYGPIVWRSLRCANALVRSQAAMVFFDAFPLRESNATAAEIDSIMQKQFDLLSFLLKDADHRVRAVATSGVCHILREYWELLPTHTTKQILSYVVGTLGHDNNCANVRLAVLTGLNELLDQPISHTVLQKLLPLLTDALHDKSLAVRVAFVNILNKVKNIRGFHFCEIASVDRLQKQLGEDINRPSMCKAMTELLLNSYYPQMDKNILEGGSTERNGNQLQRCLLFIKENVAASAAFYSTFYLYTSVGSAAKMVTMLSRLFDIENYFENYLSSQLESLSLSSLENTTHVMTVTRKNKSKRERERGNSSEIGNNENSEENGHVESIIKTTPGILVGVYKLAVLRVIFSCLTSISGKLKDDPESMKMLLKYFTTEHVSRKIFLLKSNNFEKNDNLQDNGEEEEKEEGEGSSTSVEYNTVNAQLTPLLLKIVALVWKNCENNNGNNVDENGSNSILNSDLILSDYIQNWNLKSKKLLDEKTYAEKNNSYVTLVILKSLKSDSFLTNLIAEPFRYLSNMINTDSKKLKSFEICSSPEPISGKIICGKRKPKNNSSSVLMKETADVPVLPLGPAVELFIELQNNELNLNNNKWSDEVFTIMKTILTTTFKSEQSCNEMFLSIDSSEEFNCKHVMEVLSQCMYAWSVNMIRATTLDSKNDSMKVLLTWMDVVLLSFITNSFNCDDTKVPQFSSPGFKCPPRSKSRRNATPNGNFNIDVPEDIPTVRAMSLAVEIFQGVLLLLSDALVMRVGIDDVSRFLGTVALQLSGVSDKLDVSLQVLKPVFERISGLLQPFGEEEKKIGESLKKLNFDGTITEMGKENIFENDENSRENENKINSPHVCTPKRKNIIKKNSNSKFDVKNDVSEIENEDSSAFENIFKRLSL